MGELMAEDSTYIFRVSSSPTMEGSHNRFVLTSTEKRESWRERELERERGRKGVDALDGAAEMEKEREEEGGGGSILFFFSTLSIISQ
jgi:hypothetical protein